MDCSACGYANDADAAFCESCGAPLARTCPQCGTRKKPAARFCKKCGTSLTTAPAAPTPPVPAPAASHPAARLAELRQATPAPLAQKILAAREQTEGERKPVTILFTDIVGSTSLAEKLDPEEWKEIVSGAHRRVGEAIYRYEGTLAQLLGDGVLAFFGAPITHEDDPLRAVRAALDIQQAIAVYACELEPYTEWFQMRVGLHTGTVVVGQIGSERSELSRERARLYGPAPGECGPARVVSAHGARHRFLSPELSV